MTRYPVCTPITAVVELVCLHDLPQSIRWLVTCATLLLASIVHAAPPHKDFKNLPDRLFYFKDTPVGFGSVNNVMCELNVFDRLLFTMTLWNTPYTYLRTKVPNGTVYRMSRKARHTCSLNTHTTIASSVPFTALHVLCANKAKTHPFTLQAYILSRGKKHWRTTDRGKLWQSFELPVKVTMTARPLAFHADKTKEGHVLYHGTRCEGVLSWIRNCDDEVCICLTFRPLCLPNVSTTTQRI